MEKDDRVFQPHHVVEDSAAQGIPIAPSFNAALHQVKMPLPEVLVDRRILYICSLAVLLGFLAAGVSQALTWLIGFITNLSFYGDVSGEFRSPAHHQLGYWVLIVPAVGGVLVGLMARYGSQSIRGHGIPEAMENVLTQESRILPRLTFLKPLSAAVAIGTGGPFGAEGPIIATGGALGSVLGQGLHTTASERKTLLGSGAAAGMAAIFASPVSAVILAMELLLFEFRPRSIIPVALASVTATGVRYYFVGAQPVFPMPLINPPSGEALFFYTLLGAMMGLAAVAVTKLVYWIEDAFACLPIHWMWWPAIGGLVVGAVGLMEPNTLGVGYINIERAVSGELIGKAALVLCVLKCLSWSIALGSGTSGGTLAPLFTIGGTLGALMGETAQFLIPQAQIDIRVSALVGMAALFAGASRAMLASVVFAFETTLQPMGLLPLLGGCSASYLLSCLFMKNTIMTEKIARRGIRVPSEYSADFFDRVLVRETCNRNIITLPADQSLQSVRDWIASGHPDAQHQGFPVVDSQGTLLGVVTRRDLLNGKKGEADRVRDLIQRPPVIVFEHSTLREAINHMVRENVGRLPVLKSPGEGHVVGMLTRGDLLSIQMRLLNENTVLSKSWVLFRKAPPVPAVK